MDRRRTTKLLTALYGMDTHRPEWAPVLGALAQVFQATPVTVYRLDSQRLQGRVSESSEGAAQATAASEHDASSPPWFARALDRLRSEGLVNTADLAPSDSPYDDAAEFSCPVHSMAFCMHGDRSEEMIVLTVTRARPAADFDEDERALARSLLPHLRNVCAWQERFDSIDHQSERFRTALDALAEGVLMLDRAGRPVFCNAAARNMACHHLFAWKSDGRLGMVTPGDEHQLQQALRGLGALDAVEPVLLQIHGNHGRLMATLKLCPAPPPDGADSQVRTIAFIKLLEPLAQPTLVPGLKAQWGFTFAEAQLAQQLMHGLSLDEAARRISVTKNTVRTQLRSLFMKTETHRQAELVRVLLKLSHV